MRAGLLSAAALLCVCGCGSPPAALAATSVVSDPVTCEEKTVQVRLSRLSLFNTIPLKGSLCYRGAYRNKRLLLTVHGVTYNRNYFDFSFNEGQYSYVKHATAQGHAVFNIDRIGNGASAHPTGTFVTLDASAFTVYQVITHLRNGALTTDGYRFTNIVYVGHSYGSFLGVRLAARFPDAVDAVVLTGFMHDINLELVTFDALNLATGFVPAQLDPKFGLTFPLGYVTLTRDFRELLFFNPGSVDPAVIAQDYEERDVMSTSVIPDIVAAVALPESLLITKPVLIVTGEFDHLFCHGLIQCSVPGAALAAEQPRFSPAADLHVTIIPNTGHDLNMHPTYLDTFAAIDGWLAGH